MSEISTPYKLIVN